jgi:hypothetical protein
MLAAEKIQAIEEHGGRFGRGLGFQRKGNV